MANSKKEKEFDLKEFMDRNTKKYDKLLRELAKN